MRVVIVARHGANQQSGLELERAYRVYDGPDQHGRVLVFDEVTTGFRWVTTAEYREVPDPLDRHDLVAIDQGPGGYAPVCSCVWRWHRGWPDPDEAAHLHGVHQRHMASQRRLLTQPVPPPLLAWIEQLRANRRRQEQER
jgi:hypothetical protein